MKKKIVWLPYDFDTAIGINNEGALVFGYELEDIDHIEGGANVFNGQDSVVWVNIRKAFSSELAAMYRKLRSQGKLSYAVVEQMFEEHQNKWPEAVFNEDSWFKYIDPLVKDGSGAYLAMLQGSKAEQRKWWLYNRFRYIDSKYNAGDALNDLIQVRGYAKADITVTPYADIYPSIKYGSYLVQKRGKRNVATTLECPLDSVNDTEIYIYSSSQLASVGDLSGLKIGFADFSMATKLQDLKVGDSSASYSNGNLGSGKNTFTLGNNVLLKTIDVRNCVALGTGDQKSVDLSGCTNIEEVYFEGTAINGLSLPNGGVLRVLHLPATITNLTIQNQSNITDFVMPSFANISTLRLENVSSAVNSKAIVQAIPVNSRVRIIGFRWECTDAAEIDSVLDVLDTMRGLNEAGDNVDKAQVSGVIHTTSLTGDQIAEFNERYQYITIEADHVESTLYYYNYDGTQLLNTETIYDGGDGTYTGQPARTASAQYTYTFAGWALTPNGSANANAMKNVVATRSIYAAYTATLRSYTVYFYNGSTLLQTVPDVPYGGSATYTGETPQKTDVSTPTDFEFIGWSPAPTSITGDVSCYAKYKYIAFVETITDSWEEIIENVNNGTYASKYSVGDTKVLEFGDVQAEMQIVAMNTDRRLDVVGYSDLTWISTNLLDIKRRMNPAYSANVQGTGSLGGWKKSEMRSWERSSLLPLIPDAVQNSIPIVEKYTQTYTSESSKSDTKSGEKLWMPSYYEMTGYDDIEKVGTPYSYCASNINARRKKVPGNTAYSPYALRSAGSRTQYFSGINAQGNGVANNYAEAENNFPLCFCIGREEITDSWSAIIAACSDGSYSNKYSIGDYKKLEIAGYGAVNMQIVAMSADELEDGSGTAPISWLATVVLGSKQRLNPSSVGAIGGWGNSELRTWMRTTLYPALDQTIQSGIKNVKKYSDSYESASSSVVHNIVSIDNLWIPSYREVLSATGAETAGYSLKEAGRLFYEVYNSKGALNTALPTLRYKQENYENDDFSTGAAWWTRSAKSNNNFYLINEAGSSSSYGAPASSENGILFGFCT